MLATILGILKVVGIILLIVVLILLLAICLILFVPVRYGAKASYDEKPLANATLSWLMHLVSFRADYEEGLTYSLRVLGINIFRKKPGDEDISGPQKEVIKEAEEEAERDFEKQAAFEEKTEQEERLTEPKTELDREESEERGADARILRDWDKAEEAGEELRDMSPLRSIRPAMREFFRDIRSWLIRLRDFIKERIRYVRVELWESAVKKKDWLVWFITDPENIATRHLLWRQLKKLLIRIKPREVEGDVKFGYDDPYKTGQILVAISPFYPLYGAHITVTPVFDENVAEGRISLKGRIRIFDVLYFIGRMMLDKNFRTWVKWFVDS